MKIAHIVCSYPPYYSGMGNAVFNTASNLSKLGHDVAVFTPGVYEEKEVKQIEEEVEPVHEEKLQKEIDYAKRLRPSLSYGNAARLPQIGKELSDFDLVHLHYPFFGTANLIRRWKKQNPDTPFVITYHMDNRAQGWKGLVFDIYARYWMPRILGSADRLIASSFDYIKSSDAAQIYKDNQDKWLEIPFGVDVEKFKPREKTEALFEKHGLDIDTPTIVFVGGMDRAHYFKGVSVLLEALLFIKKQEIDLQAVFVGGGELKDGFELKSIAYGLKDRVKFAGFVSDQELPYYYNMADLAVLPSITRGEACGMVLLEAMASGVPVVASDLPGVRSVAKDGGLVVEANQADKLAEAILGFFASKENIAGWREKVRQIAVDKYSWEEVAKRLVKVYEEIM